MRGNNGINNGTTDSELADWFLDMGKAGNNLAAVPSEIETTDW